MTEGPPGNRLYLVCQSHTDVTDAILLGSRLSHGYHAAAGVAQLSKWFERHKDCGEGPDHFQLAMAKIANWDQTVDEVTLEPVASAVKLSLVKS